MSPAGVTTVGVVGASARAAVGSLLRAGFAAWAVDLFADRDLRRMAPCVRCLADDYPEALPRLADDFPPGPVLYTGGLENRPDVVRELAARRPLWGNPPEVLEQVRDPFRLHGALSAAGLQVPRVLSAHLHSPGRWVRKPVRSAGGQGMRFAAPDDPPSPAFYLQEFVNGRSMSAVFVGPVLVSINEQLVGEAWLHAGPFRYSGSVGPVQCEPPWADDLHRVREVLTTAFGLRGIWGVDFILSGGRVWPVEVNPRYTASMEVVEYATGVPGLHGDAAGFADPTPTPPLRREGLRHAVLTPPSFSEKGAGGLGSRHIGKAIYFAPHRITFPPTGPWDADLTGEFDPWRRLAFADIPDPGEVIEPGWPVLTFFAEGSTADECRSRLQSTAAELDRLFGAAEPTP